MKNYARYKTIRGVSYFVEDEIEKNSCEGCDLFLGKRDGCKIRTQSAASYCRKNNIIYRRKKTNTRSLRALSEERQYSFKIELGQADIETLIDELRKRGFKGVITKEEVTTKTYEL